MERDENNEHFVPADVFLENLSSQQQQAPGAQQHPPVIHKRASLAQLAGIQNKISLWEKKGPVQLQGPTEGPVPLRKPGAARRAAAPPTLAPVSEEAERRQPASSSRSTRSVTSRGSVHSAHSGSLLSRAAAAVHAVLPSPGTKQAMAARQEAVRFPSIMFGAKPAPKQPTRAPLPRLSSEDASQWRLAAGALPVSPREQQQQQQGAEVAGQADVGEMDVRDDASDSSSEWHDASEVQVVLRDDDDQSVSSEATTVVPGEDAAEDDSTANSWRQPAPPAVPEAPMLHSSDSPPLPTEQQHVSRRRPLGLLAASEVFHSAMDMLPLDGSLALAGSGSFSLGRMPLVQPEEGTAESGPSPSIRNGVLGATETSQLASEPLSFAPDMASLQGDASAVKPAVGVTGRGVALSPAADCVGVALVPVQEATSGPSEAVGAAGERGVASLDAPVAGQGAAVVAPLGLRREFSEANLCYLGASGSPEAEVVDHQQQGTPVSLSAAAPTSSQQQQQQQEQQQQEGAPWEGEGGGESATPVHHCCPELPAIPQAPANTPVTPAVPLRELAAIPEAQAEECSMPVEATAVASAISGLAGEHGQPLGGSSTAVEAPAAAAAAVPELLSPYPATEYDGEDVVMGDAGFTPKPSAFRWFGSPVGAAVPSPQHLPAAFGSPPMERRLFDPSEAEHLTSMPAAEQISQDQPGADAEQCEPLGSPVLAANLPAVEADPWVEHAGAGAEAASADGEITGKPGEQATLVAEEQANRAGPVPTGEQEAADGPCSSRAANVTSTEAAVEMLGDDLAMGSPGFNRERLEEEDGEVVLEGPAEEPEDEEAVVGSMEESAALEVGLQHGLESVADSAEASQAGPGLQAGQEEPASSADAIAGLVGEALASPEAKPQQEEGLVAVAEVGGPGAAALAPSSSDLPEEACPAEEQLTVDVAACADAHAAEAADPHLGTPGDAGLAAEVADAAACALAAAECVPSCAAEVDQDSLELALAPGMTLAEGEELAMQPLSPSTSTAAALLSPPSGVAGVETAELEVSEAPPSPADSPPAAAAEEEAVASPAAAAAPSPPAAAPAAASPAAHLDAAVQPQEDNIEDAELPSTVLLEAAGAGIVGSTPVALASAETVEEEALEPAASAASDAMHPCLSAHLLSMPLLSGPLDLAEPEQQPGDAGQQASTELEGLDMAAVAADDEPNAPAEVEAVAAASLGVLPGDIEEALAPAASTVSDTMHPCLSAHLLSMSLPSGLVELAEQEQKADEPEAELPAEELPGGAEEAASAVEAVPEAPGSPAAASPPAFPAAEEEMAASPVCSPAASLQPSPGAASPACTLGQAAGAALSAPEEAAPAVDVAGPVAPSSPAAASPPAPPAAGRGLAASPACSPAVSLQPSILARMDEVWMGLPGGPSSVDVAAGAAGASASPEPAAAASSPAMEATLATDPGQTEAEEPVETLEGGEATAAGVEAAADRQEEAGGSMQQPGAKAPDAATAVPAVGQGEGEDMDMMDVDEEVPEHAQASSPADSRVQVPTASCAASKAEAPGDDAQSSPDAASQPASPHTASLAGSTMPFSASPSSLPAPDSSAEGEVAVGVASTSTTVAAPTCLPAEAAAGNVVDSLVSEEAAAMEECDPSTSTPPASPIPAADPGSPSPAAEQCSRAGGPALSPAREPILASSQVAAVSGEEGLQAASSDLAAALTFDTIAQEAAGEQPPSDPASEAAEGAEGEAAADSLQPEAEQTAASAEQPELPLPSGSSCSGVAAQQEECSESAAVEPEDGAGPLGPADGAGAVDPSKATAAAVAAAASAGSPAGSMAAEAASAGSPAGGRLMEEAPAGSPAGGRLAEEASGQQIEAADVDGPQPGGDSPPALAGADSPTMSVNPLAASLTPHASFRSSAAAWRASPALSGLSGGAAGAFSNNNPLFAGTPGHPTPPSVTLRSFPSSRLTGPDGTPLPSQDGGATPASVGMKLAERLQEVASQLQQPAAEQAPGTALAGATPGQPAAAQLRTPGAGRFAFASDVAAMLQALDQRTPATALMPAAGGRAAAMATTTQRQPRLARFSFATAGNGAAAAMFDLEGYDVDGNRNNGAASTPAHIHAAVMVHGPGQASSPAAEASGEAREPLGAEAAAELEELRQEAAALRSQVRDLEAQHEDAVGMLAGYQGSIAQLQDQHSAIMVQLQAENAWLKAEMENLRCSKAEVERQFNRLYHEKYVPLKREAAPLRQEAAALRAVVASEEAKARTAELAAQRLHAELETAKEQLEAAKEEKAAALAAATAAQQAEQRCRAELKHNAQLLAAAEGEAAEAKARYGGLARQYDEAVHKLNLAKQARERAHSDMQRKEEEICGLEVRLREVEGVLREYKKENSRFFDMKERYKAQIAALERAVQAKEDEKQQLLSMCNELMTQLEREGLALDS